MLAMCCACMQEQEISEDLLATVVINDQHFRGALDAVRFSSFVDAPEPSVALESLRPGSECMCTSAFRAIPTMSTRFTRSTS